ncbi:MAG: type III secretion inner membrane ring lipoprotein SctJ [Pseudomonadota bacterium]
MVSLALRAGWRRAAILVLIPLLAACQTDLYSNLTEREANEIISVLNRHGISADKKPGGRDAGLIVTVDQTRFAEAVAILNSRGLPREDFRSLGEVFNGDRLVTSPTEERARLMYALSQELSQTVAQIDGVISARVHVVLPESDALSRQIKPSSASVFIRRDAEAPVDRFLPQIKMLIENSIEGLDYEKISVIDIPVAVAEPQPVAAISTEQVLGVAIDPRDKPRLMMVLGALAGLALAAIAAAIALLIWRRRGPSEAATMETGQSAAIVQLPRSKLGSLPPADQSAG